MTICIVGLGLIGGSLALSLKRAGYAVCGYDRDEAVCSYALSHGIVREVVTEYTSFDVVMVALPPQATMQFITHTQFAMGAVVCDICGVKQPIEQAAYSVTAPIRYVGMHPMAGKEVSGITNASETLFDRASMVITHGDKTDGQALDMAKKLTKDMGFARIVECTAAIHDRKIAYTSQLAHIVSNAYVKDDEINNCLGFTGGSFQDMTRIGGVDENMWSELYLLNSEQICQKIGTLIHNLKALQTAISSGDDIALKAVLREGRIRFENSQKTVDDGEDIIITRLK